MLQASTAAIQTALTSVSEIRPDATPQIEQPELVEASPVPPELSPRQELLRPEHWKAMPEIDMIGSQFEETALNRIIKHMTLLYVEGHTLVQQAKNSVKFREISRPRA